MTNLKIIIKIRANDFHACLEDHPEIWGCGKTSNEAIGDLINSHQDIFNITIQNQLTQEGH